MLSHTTGEMFTCLPRLQKSFVIIIQTSTIIIPGIDSVVIFDSGAYKLSPETLCGINFKFFSSYQALILLPSFYSILQSLDYCRLTQLFDDSIARVISSSSTYPQLSSFKSILVVDFPEVAVRNLVQSSCCCQCYPYCLGCLKQNLLLCGFQDWRH